MATLHPFRALRPKPEFAQEVACVPYDVINTAEARALAKGKPSSFLHIIRPEIDLPEGTDEHADVVYETGANNLAAYGASEVSMLEATPALYVYRLIMDGRSQTGVYGCVSVDEYNDDTILKHEKTRPDKEADRTLHIVKQRAHAEPVMMTFRDHDAVQSVIEATQQTAPLYDFTAPDGIQHTIWRVPQNAEHADLTVEGTNPNAEDARQKHADLRVEHADLKAELIEAFTGVPKLYIADGHHRCKAASLAAEQVTPDSGEEHRFFPAVLFPMSEMAILPYNRIVYALPEGAATFLKVLSRHLIVTPTDHPSPQQAGEISIYLEGKWYHVTLPPTERDSVVDTLDVARLSEFILEPLLGIEDVRTDPNIYFVGGIRGTKELERIVNEGEAALAISMYPTSIQELIDVSDAGLLMPPKSTWFEPKLRSGLLVHLMDQ